MMAFESVARKKIRRLRKNRGLTLRALSNHCNCSSALLSQIETGAVNPSLATLVSIAEGLGVSLYELFYDEPTKNNELPCVMHPEERKTLLLKGEIQFQLLTRGIDVPFEFVLLKFPPETSAGIDIHIHDGSDLHTHEGAECGLILEGELEVQVEKNVYHLKQGDSITLTSLSPHKLSNPGRKEAVAIWVDSKPFLFSVL
jgi:transcriptional regulator with XRE-family HTH domain